MWEIMARVYILGPAFNAFVSGLWYERSDAG